MFGIHHIGYSKPPPDCFGHLRNHHVIHHRSNIMEPSLATTKRIIFTARQTTESPAPRLQAYQHNGSSFTTINHGSLGSVINHISTRGLVHLSDLVLIGSLRFINHHHSHSRVIHRNARPCVPSTGRSSDPVRETPEVKV